MTGALGLAVNSALVFVFAGSWFSWMKAELEKPVELQIDVDAKAGPGRHLSVTMAPHGRVDEFGPNGLLLSARDVTDVVEAAVALEELVDSKDRFIATVSHELRTPITAVVGSPRSCVIDSMISIGEEHGSSVDSWAET